MGNNKTSLLLLVGATLLPSVALAQSINLLGGDSAQSVQGLGFQVIAAWDIGTPAPASSQPQLASTPLPTRAPVVIVSTQPPPAPTPSAVTVLGPNAVDTQSIQAGAVILGTKTTGVYQQSTQAGSGIAVGGSEGEGWIPTISLANLSDDWVQKGAYDIILDNSSSELKIRESDGSAFAVIDAGDLAEDVTYTLSGGSGTLLTSGNYSTHISEISGALQAANNLSDLGSAATARTNLGLGTVATQASDAVSITGGAIDSVAIGGTTTSTGAFSTLTSSGATTLSSSSGNTTIGNASSTLELISSGLDVSTTGALSGVTGFTQDSGNFSIAGAGTFSTGTGGVSLNGNTTVASGSTLAVTSADSLTVASTIIPQTVFVSFNLTATLVDQTVFIADNDYVVNSARCIYSVAALSGGTLQVSVETGTTAPGAGTDQLSSSLNLSSTVNTVQTGSVIGSPTTISTGDRVSIDVGGTLTNLIGHCTVGLKRT